MTKLDAAFARLIVLFVAWTVICGLTGHGCHAQAAPSPEPDHPLVGSWEVYYEGGRVFDATFHADGRLKSSEGEAKGSWEVKDGVLKIVRTFTGPNYISVRTWRIKLTPGKPTEGVVLDPNTDTPFGRFELKKPGGK